MYVDVIKYLQTIPEDEWTTGNESKYAFKDGHFIKCLKHKAPDKVHSFFTTNKLNNTLGSFIPTFEMYYTLKDDDLRLLNKVTWNVGAYPHVYVFSKVAFLDLRLFYNKRESKDVIPVLDDLHAFFNELDEENIVYQDACWENIGCNKVTGKLCVIDIDSMVDNQEIYDKIKNFGSPLFHTSFLQFKRKYPHLIHNIKWLNLCTFHNMLFAFVIGLAIDNTEYTFMKKKSAVNAIVTSYINGNYTNKVDTPTSFQFTLDDESVNVLKRATQIVRDCMEGDFDGISPYADMARLATELVDKYPTVRVPQQIPITPKITTSPIVSGSSGYSSQVMNQHTGRSSNPYSTKTPASVVTGTTKYSPPPPLSKMSKSRGGPNVLLTLAHAMTVLTIVMMLINVFIPHDSTVAANNSTNMTGNNNSTIIADNASLINTPPVVNVSAGNVSDIQTIAVNSTNTTMLVNTATAITLNSNSTPEGWSVTNSSG